MIFWDEFIGKLKIIFLVIIVFIVKWICKPTIPYLDTEAFNLC